jgi:hypothetical protein
MIAQLNQREKILAGAIGAVLAIAVNIFLIQFFLSNRTKYGKQLTDTRARIETLRKRETERELWSQREAWLNEKMPAIGDPDVANKALRESLMDIARKYIVTLNAPAPGIPTTQPSHISLSVRIEASAPWPAMFDFLHDLQGPEKFVAIENCELKVNRENKTQLRGSLTVAQWFASK